MNVPSSSIAWAEYFLVLPIAVPREVFGPGRAATGHTWHRADVLSTSLLKSFTRYTATTTAQRDERIHQARSCADQRCAPRRGECQCRSGLDEVLRKIAAAVDGNRQAGGGRPGDRNQSVDAATSGNQQDRAARAADEPQRVDARVTNRKRQQVRHRVPRTLVGFSRIRTL